MLEERKTTHAQSYKKYISLPKRLCRCVCVCNVNEYSECIFCEMGIHMQI